MNVIKKERSKTYTYQSNNYPDTSKERPRGMSTNSSRQSSGRELGVVEKLLASYGFVQPVGENSSIFFHYSEFIGDIQTLQIGETLSFLVRTDRRSGKPVAVQLARATSVSPTVNGYSSEQVVLSYSVDGLIENQAKLLSDNGYCEGSATVGRVSYDKGGEMFFLPYTCADLEVGQHPKKGDKVSFCIVQDKRSGNLQVRQMRVTEACSKADSAEESVDCTYKGVISSLKEGFGFIERADVVSEIFFHYSQFEDDISVVEVGDDVGFEIQSRNGKDVAVNVIRLPVGSVVFEEASAESYTGEIVKVASRAKMNSSMSDDQLNGIIEFSHNGNCAEINYSEKDMANHLNLRVGDNVVFLLCTDLRDGLQRAVDLQVVHVSSKNGQEKERGVVCNVREGFGFIKCCNREANVFFHFSELIEQNGTPSPGEEVEFFVLQDENGRYSASRITTLPKGTVEFETLSEEFCQGKVTKEPTGLGSKGAGKAARDGEVGTIVMEEDTDDEDGPLELSFRSRDCKPREFPQVGDKVEFMIATNKRNGQMSAREVSIVKRNRASRQSGFICAMKEHYGFIETADHASDVFFHFSESTFNANSLALGDEVQFAVIRKNGKQCAENVSKLKRGSIPTEEVLPGVYDGTVVRPVRTVDPQQPTYEGVIAKVTTKSVAMDEKKKSRDVESTNGESDSNREEVDEENSADDDAEEEEEMGERFPFGITSLVDKKDPLHPGDRVTFQVGVDANGQRRAMCIRCARSVEKARVESVKGQFGFIAYETPDSKNLFFHMSEVEAGSGTIEEGDMVEFIIVKSHKNAKQSAMKIKRVADSPKPGHLMRRRENTPVKSTFVAIRKPIGPDGTIGFKKRAEVKG